ncbi:hypothetical protein FC59_GL001036 [Lactobacillus kitasatonis DSM 16761 = JCM 1039]|uniref:Uncharacterized protein n=1 Tax=Lactobacillus kitasatonis DSM 16761 = JCM 1039 TaxID=1423767 RepID=A0A0R1VF56_9LACO|nr:hypothetical protein FC59_GL001036 [Lactobacillus kitasatonis DSM 16761 = JCM 1039]
MPKLDIFQLCHIFNSKEALQDEILSIALGSFKSKLSYKTAKSISELNERLMAAFKEVSGLIHEVICNNENVINRLTGIVAPLLAEICPRRYQS